MKPISAPVGWSSDEPHRWFGQIKTRLSCKDKALNERSRSALCQSLSGNCNAEDILEGWPNKLSEAGSFLSCKTRPTVYLNASRSVGVTVQCILMVITKVAKASRH